MRLNHDLEHRVGNAQLHWAHSSLNSELLSDHNCANTDTYVDKAMISTVTYFATKAICPAHAQARYSWADAAVHVPQLTCHITVLAFMVDARQ